MNPLTLLTAFVLALGQPTHHTRIATCPVADTEAVRLVKKFVRIHTEFQTAHSMSPIDTASVRSLVDATDSTACAQLNDAFGSAPNYSYLTAGGYYFAIQVNPVATRADGTTYTAEWKPLAVFDATMNFIGIDSL